VIRILKFYTPDMPMIDELEAELDSIEVSLSQKDKDMVDLGRFSF
jgi:hypothetical protein